MTAIAKKIAIYDELYNIPENMVGEIVDGELIATPRPSAEHGYAASNLGAEIIPSYRFGRNGTGGWIIIDEQEISFGDNILVPDLAGWKRERFSKSKDHNWINVIPDWICEIISPSSARIDRIKKMRIYLEYKVPYAWIVDPVQMTLEVYKFDSGKWLMLESYEENEKVRAEPFQDIEIDLGNLWLNGLLVAPKEQDEN